MEAFRTPALPDDDGDDDGLLLVVVQAVVVAPVDGPVAVEGDGQQREDGGEGHAEVTVDPQPAQRLQRQHGAQPVSRQHPLNTTRPLVKVDQLPPIHRRIKGFPNCSVFLYSVISE